MNIKVSVVSRDAAPMTGVYLDYVTPTVPDNVSDLIKRDVDSYARMNGSSSHSQGGSYPADKWAFCKIQIGLRKSDSDLVLIRARESDRLMCWEYPGSHCHPYYMAGTSLDVLDGRYSANRDDPQFRRDMTAHGWAYFDIYSVPEVLGKNAEETRTLLAEGNLTTYRNQQLSLVGGRTPLGSIYIRVEDDWDMSKRSLWVSLSAKPAKDRSPDFWQDDPHKKGLEPNSGTTRNSVGLQEGSFNFLTVFEQFEQDHVSNVTLVRWPRGSEINDVLNPSAT